MTLIGPTGEKIVIKRGRRVRLPDFFDRYAKRGFLTLVTESNVTDLSNRKKPRAKTPLVFKQYTKDTQEAISKQIQQTQKAKRQEIFRQVSVNEKRLGKSRYQGAIEDYKKTLQANYYPISNNIGVGILSYNRLQCLQRCIDSIYRFTDLKKTTIFISDDNSSDVNLLNYLDTLSKNNDFVILKNSARLGIAGNSNRLMRCLARFKYKILLNDDVEIVSDNWEHFYPKAMEKTGFHHFCCNTPGVYGAKDITQVDVKGMMLGYVTDKPHGAVLAYDQAAFERIGYFDENFGMYGMEHVDWSDRVARIKLQQPGYFDVSGSNSFFSVHADKSASPDRVEHLMSAREYYKSVTKRVGYVSPTQKSAIPTISYIVPYRDIHRTKALVTVINNIRAQRYPGIEIILTEQDDSSKVKIENLTPIKKLFTQARPGTQFNKSIAFNVGVDACETDMMVLHDADLLMLKDYTAKLVSKLADHDSCFMGGKVLYASKQSSDMIVDTAVASNDVICDKYVDYFEGGSVGIKKAAYWKIGGFNEDFYGYGCEDTDFYARLAATKFNECRSASFLHIWHPRTPGWEACHHKNKQLEAKLKSLQITERINRLRLYLKTTKYAKYL